jgi:hypothetical protein
MSRGHAALLTGTDLANGADLPESLLPSTNIRPRNSPRSTRDLPWSTSSNQWSGQSSDAIAKIVPAFSAIFAATLGSNRHPCTGTRRVTLPAS